MFRDESAVDPNCFAVQLVNRGFIVLAPEVIGFGDRRLMRDMRKDPQKASSCVSLSGQLLMLGRTLAGLRVYEAMRSVDYLLTRNDIDFGRIGCMGFSSGGLIAAMSVALDHRIQATVLSAFASTLHGTLWSITHCIDNYLPAILSIADLPELIGLIAPRGLFVEAGTGDPLFPISSVEDAIKQLSSMFKNHDAAHKFDFDLFPGSHEVCGRRAYDWLETQLMFIQ